MSAKKILKQRQCATETHQFSDDFHPLLKRIYLHRGITREEEISTELKDLLSFHALLNIDQAAELLGESIKTQKKLLIIGDFDTDGATSTALAVLALKALGAQSVDYLIPNRFEYGYGLTPEIVDKAREYEPDILITVDNGISSHAGVLRAKHYGMKVLITDHHLAPESLPEADVIINPNQPHDNFPSKVLAGVGVIFYVMLALRDYLGAKQVHMASFLDLVALGTVADVVPLDKNNRILVQQGLMRIQKGQMRPGIAALIKASRRDYLKLHPSDLGFFVAPRLNAAGRLEDMSLGVACLLSDNPREAEKISAQLENLNLERRSIEQDMTKSAEELLSGILAADQKIPSGFCLYHPEFHQGVIGILAGRLKDRYHRPSIVFAHANETELKGSARSIANVHLRDLLVLIDMRYPGLILKFGGHAMAAGVSILAENFKKFQKIFDQVIAETVDASYFEAILFTDGELTSQEFTLENAKLLRHHSPWGQGFPEPIFEGLFEVRHQNLINNKHLKLLLRPCHKDITDDIEAILFNYEKLIDDLNIYIAYRLEVSEYQGVRKMQLNIVHVRESEPRP